MIEVIYKEAKEEATGNEKYFEMPKNIRQIGEPGGKVRIYLEDYVHTYLRNLSMEKPLNDKIGIFFGKVNWQDGITYLFLKSACWLTDMEVTATHMVFAPKDWEEVQSIQKKYFDNQEIMGWFSILYESGERMNDTVCHTHLSSFGGNDKILLLMNPGEQEENFYRYENGQIRVQSGYYIYYEKNSCMQEYMIAAAGNHPVESKKEVSDRAVLDFRSRIASQNEKKQKKTSAFLYGISAALTALCLGIGISYMNDYRTMNATTRKAVETAASIEKEQRDVTEVSITPIATATPILSPTPLPEPTKKSPEQSTPQPTVAVQPTEAPAESAQTAAKSSYTVREGDTLNKISEQIYGDIGMTAQICQLNNLQMSDIIYPGQNILLP